MSTINPYLGFNDNCEEAFTLYKSIFGGEFCAFQKFKDVPTQEGMPIDETEGEKIMHVALPLRDGAVLMGSDTPKKIGTATMGNNVSIAVSTDSKEEADKIYQGLSEGGKQTMTMADAFWGAYFGMCTDKFGVHWMVSYDHNRPKINRVVHFEIQADDLERAKKFYGEVFGWEFPKWMEDPIYWGIVTAPTGSTVMGINGGLLQRPAQTPPQECGTNSFVCTVLVHNFDETAKKIEATGGKVAMPKMAIRGMAWQGYFLDTEGNTFGIHQTDPEAK